MTEQLLSIVDAAFPLTEQPASEYAKLKARGMTFRIRTYKADGFGSLSLMEASGMMGLMKMDTLILTPLLRDVPLLSYDRIHAAGKDTILCDVLDTMTGPYTGTELVDVIQSAAGLPDYDLGTHWYDTLRLPGVFGKTGGKKQTAAFDDLAVRFMTAYVDMAKVAPAADPAEKRAKTKVYVDGLLSHGGPSTDVFVKAFGKEKTEDLYHRVLFDA